MKICFKLLFGLSLFFIIYCQDEQENKASITEFNSSSVDSQALTQQKSNEENNSPSQIFVDSQTELENPIQSEEDSVANQTENSDLSPQTQVSSKKEKISPCNKDNYREYMDDFVKIDKIIRELECRNVDLIPNSYITCLGKGCQLQGVDFSGQDLRGLVFNYANVEGANFEGANLTRVSFRKANLKNANLRTKINKSRFKNANLEGAVYDDTQSLFDGAIFFGMTFFGNSSGVAFPDERGMIKASSLLETGSQIPIL